MDPEANIREQGEIADVVMTIWDACSDDGDFTEEQQQHLIFHAYRLAELIQAMNEWIKRGGFLPNNSVKS